MNPLKISLLFICAAGASLAADHNWAIGQVLDANAKRDIMQTGTTFQSSTSGTATAVTNGSVSNYGGTSTVNATTQASGHSTTFGGTQAHHTVFQDNQVLIQGGDYIYAVDDLSLKGVGIPTTHGLITRAIANRKHGCRMVVGDPIQYEQAKDKLFVQDPDGKVCKLDIVRQERIANAQSASLGR